MFANFVSPSGLLGSPTYPSAYTDGSSYRHFVAFRTRCNCLGTQELPDVMENRG